MSHKTCDFNNCSKTPLTCKEMERGSIDCCRHFQNCMSCGQDWCKSRCNKCKSDGYSLCDMCGSLYRDNSQRYCSDCLDHSKNVDQDNNETLETMETMDRQIGE